MTWNIFQRITNLEKLVAQQGAWINTIRNERSIQEYEEKTIALQKIANQKAYSKAYYLKRKAQKAAQK